MTTLIDIEEPKMNKTVVVFVVLAMMASFCILMIWAESEPAYTLVCIEDVSYLHYSETGNLAPHLQTNGEPHECTDEHIEAVERR